MNSKSPVKLCVVHSDELVSEEPNVSEKSKEIFEFCDLDGKGYLTRTDLQKLKEEVPLTDCQLDEVFNTLDENCDEKLELKEFTDGFGMFLAIAANHSDEKYLKSSPLTNGRSLSPIREMVNDPYEEFLENVGCKKPFKEDHVLRSMWRHIAEHNPDILPDFERFLICITNDVENAKIDFFSLETAFNSRSNESEKHLHQLYENMEQKMVAEKAQLLAQENANFAKIRHQLEEEVKQKSGLLSDMKLQHDSMKDKLTYLKTEEEARKKENFELEKERDELEKKLRIAENLRLDIENEYKELNAECFKIKKRHEKSINKMSSSLSIEEEILTSEIENLRNQNKDLMDKKDIVPHKDSYKGENSNIDDETTFKFSNFQLDELQRRGSSLYDYLHRNSCLSENEDAFETDFENSLEFCNSLENKSSVSAFRRATAIAYSFADSNMRMTWKVTCQMMVNVPGPYKKKWKVKMKSIPEFREAVFHPETSSITFTQANNCKDLNAANNVQKDVQPFREMMFKVIFIGDCGVGKTSFIQRFCDDTFRATFQSTIGIDFQEKEIIVNKRRTLLQLWDTAGQERFRSICQQYFRKVNAAIVMYDTTNEYSFQNVRRWMSSIKDSTEEDIVVLLIGNKIDVKFKNVETYAGFHLAEEYCVPFFETSAKSGTNINEAMETLALLLHKRDHEEKEKLLQLKDLKEVHPKRKKWC